MLLPQCHTRDSPSRGFPRPPTSATNLSDDDNYRENRLIPQFGTGMYCTIPLSKFLMHFAPIPPGPVQ